MSAGHVVLLAAATSCGCGRRPSPGHRAAESVLRRCVVVGNCGGAGRQPARSVRARPGAVAAVGTDRWDAQGPVTFADESARLLAAFQEWAALRRTVAEDPGRRHTARLRRQVPAPAGVHVRPIRQGDPAAARGPAEAVEHLRHRPTSDARACCGRRSAEGHEPARRARRRPSLHRRFSVHLRHDSAAAAAAESRGTRRVTPAASDDLGRSGEGDGADLAPRARR